jgi:hypothetical protein
MGVSSPRVLTILLCSTLAGCTAQRAQSTNQTREVQTQHEVKRPDGTVETTTQSEKTGNSNKVAEHNALDADGAAGFFSQLLSSELGKMALYGMTGGGGVVALIGLAVNRLTKKSTELKGEQRVRAEADKAYDEGAARAKGAP